MRGKDTIFVSVQAGVTLISDYYFVIGEQYPTSFI